MTPQSTPPNYSKGGYVPPRIEQLGPIPTPVTAWQPLPVVLTEPRLGGGRLLRRFAVGVGFTFVWAWVLMLVVGALHHMALPWLPPLGYWPTLLVLLALRLVQSHPALWLLTEERAQTTQDMVKTLGGRR